MSASDAAASSPEAPTGSMTAIPIAAAAATSSLSGEQGLYTLHEPVSTTFMRDLRRVGKKLRTVLLPLATEADTLRELRDWDLWGPLLLCLILSIITSWGAPDGQKSLVFASVFVLVWCGAGVVTLNAQLLGGKLSFFQSVCVLGYCICPLVISALLGLVSRNAFWRTAVVVGGYLWATRASIVFMSELVQANRRLLAVYPVCLFYVVVAWMVFLV